MVLPELWKSNIKQDPESGHVFAFFSRNKKLVKLLQWEDGGFCDLDETARRGRFHIRNRPTAESN